MLVMMFDLKITEVASTEVCRLSLRTHHPKKLQDATN